MNAALGGRFDEEAMRRKYQAYVGESSRLLLRIRMGASDSGEATRCLEAARVDFFQHMMLTIIHNTEVLCNVVVQPVDGSDGSMPSDADWLWAASQMRLSDTQLDLALDLLEPFVARMACIQPAQQKCISEMASISTDTAAQAALVRSMERLMCATSANVLLTLLPLYLSILTAGQVASYLTATFPWLPTLPCLHRSIVAIKRARDAHKAQEEAPQPAAAKHKAGGQGPRRMRPGAAQAQAPHEPAAAAATASVASTDAAAAQLGESVPGTG